MTDNTKDITPYLKYYIGQECEYTNKSALPGERFLLTNGTILFASGNQEQFKLILRKLSSMTEEEAMEFVRCSSFYSNTKHNLKLQEIYRGSVHFEVQYDGVRRSWDKQQSLHGNYSPEHVHYLLSKGFWLWDESYFTDGLIIEKP